MIDDELVRAAEVVAAQHLQRLPGPLTLRVIPDSAYAALDVGADVWVRDDDSGDVYRYRVASREVDVASGLVTVRADVVERAESFR